MSETIPAPKHFRRIVVRQVRKIWIGNWCLSVWPYWLGLYSFYSGPVGLARGFWVWGGAFFELRHYRQRSTDA